MRHDLARNCASNSRARALIFALALQCASAIGAAESLPRLDLSRYSGVEEIGELLASYARARPDLAERRVLGVSREGREIFVLEISNPSTGAPLEKAAMYIDANMHGNEIQGAEVCLYTIDMLLRGYGQDEFITRLVDERVFLIAPCVNPDGRAHFLTQTNTPHSSRGNMRPHDSDADGLIDEDGFEDLDGDGEIQDMRRRVAGGELIQRQDPRILERAGLDETGEWEMLGPEGIDSDGDGRVNEDGPGGVDLNRNFPAEWAPDHEQGGAGPYPLSEPESLAIFTYLMQWPNLAAVQSYHNFGGMILRPPGSSSDRDAGMPGEDREVFDALGRRGESLLPGYRYLQTFEGLYRVRGGFLDWGYLERGIIFFTNELWDFPQDYDKNGSVSEPERLRWNDEVLGGKGYKEWTPFEHPNYGAIEIGGWRKLSRRIPPSFQLEEMCYRNTRFTLVHADEMPRVEIVAVKVKSFSDRLHHVDVTIFNRGTIPTATAMARKKSLALADLCTLKGRHLNVLGAGLLGRDDLQARMVEQRPARNPGIVAIGNLNGKSAVIVRFVVEGWSEAEVVVESAKGGVARKTFKLKEEQ